MTLEFFSPLRGFLLKVNFSLLPFGARLSPLALQGGDFVQYFFVHSIIREPRNLSTSVILFGPLGPHKKNKPPKKRRPKIATTPWNFLVTRAILALFLLAMPKH